MTYEYSHQVGLQPGVSRQAGMMAVFDHLYYRLVDKVGTVILQYGELYQNVDLSDKYSIEFPEKLLDLPFIALAFVSESYMEPGIGRMMIDGDETHTGFTKILTLNIDIWARTNIERKMIADSILYCVNSSWKFFRQVGIRELKHIGSKTATYEQERAPMFQRTTAQTSSRVWRLILQIQVEYDLVMVIQPEDDGGIIEQIIIDGDLDTGVGGEFTEVIGGLTELMLDRKFVMQDQLKGVGLTW